MVLPRVAPFPLLVTGLALAASHFYTLAITAHNSRLAEIAVLFAGHLEGKGMLIHTHTHTHISTAAIPALASAFTISRLRCATA